MPELTAQSTAAPATPLWGPPLFLPRQRRKATLDTVATLVYPRVPDGTESTR